MKKEEVEIFPARINKFETDIKLFYNTGITTFLTKVEPDDDETYYLHALRYYIPRFAIQTWDNHRCGVGVFTMQGFERRYKESKTIMRKFSNNKHTKAGTNVKKAMG